MTLGVGVSSSKSGSTQSGEAARVTALSAGNDLIISAGRDVVSQGAQIDAGNDAVITASGLHAQCRRHGNAQRQRSALHACARCFGQCAL
ncbi:hemagglutinin repeat-containing protein [Pannonibacter phragmitetus]|uniref:hemagglutinin repeat-containing protein n=1 Tax=Pannonibacter phragmitetus TaxID=121719 RepID=UPI003CC7D82E